MTLSPGTYRIKNAKSYTVLDLSRKEGNQIHGWQEHNQGNQHWFVQRSGNGFVFKNVESGQYAYVERGGNGVRLHGSNNSTTWRVQQENDEWFIFLDGTNYVVDLDMGHKENGTTIHLWDKTGAKQQRWYFEKINDNSGGQAYQQPPPQQQYNPPPQQQYNPPPQQPHYPPPQQPQQPPQQQGPVAAGIYFIKNVKTGTVFDLSRGEANEGADIFGYDHNGGNNQKWQVETTGHGQNVKIRNLQAGTYASFPGQSFAQGVLVKASSQAQEYIITAADRGFYVSPAQQPGYVLDLARGSKENGTKICVWQNNQQDNQKWYFERAQG
ncbi:hypothetical protein CTheo_7338 [Ceratobasidium theobromae]|uniref:Ricin B lectin domain-containing protein n=1 Tax=Ceratobasidium theobromae TaxID=1582974 RepID=A0A5N5QCQ4_9AGAM|nr:hypothetical protein CTheo_7338 [Ceratobasidium theobromae]